MRPVLLGLVLVGCSAAPESGVHATPSQRAVVEALAHKHGVDCAEVAAASPDPVPDLVWVAENWPSPGWIGVRAAECLEGVADAATYEAVATRWAADPASLGLAETVADWLPALEPATAERLERALAAGPHASLVRGEP